MTSRVLVIYTGGTIGMVPSDPSNPASPLRPGTGDDLLRSVPDLSDIGVEIAVEGLVDRAGRPVPPLDSSDVGPAHWRHLAARIGAAYDGHDGFVVLHGTDTMAYTASALSFMLENLAKPVVVTGSQLPIAAEGSDAPANLDAALRIAGWRATGLPLVPEVVICFGDVVLRGNRARKTSARSWRGFASPNLRPLGTIGDRIEIDERLVRPPPAAGAPFVARPELDDRVADLTLVPGMPAGAFLPVLTSPSIRGVVLRTFGAGNAPSRPDLLDAIGAAVDAGTVVVNVTQCPEGMVETGLYATGRALLERGVASGIDMTPEAALTKLMALLAQEDAAAVAAQVQVDRRGEQSQSLVDVRHPPADGVAAGGPVALRPPDGLDPARLVGAVVRIGGVGLEGVAAGTAYRLRLLIDGHDQPPAATSTGVYDAAGVDLVADVTAAIAPVLAAGRAVTLTLVADEGVRVVRHGEVHLALSTR